jgi:hypothetical protein
LDQESSGNPVYNHEITIFDFSGNSIPTGDNFITHMHYELTQKARFFKFAGGVDFMKPFRPKFTDET